MSIISCTCENPKFANLNRPNCVIEMKAIAFPIIVPRFKADGSRNTIDLSSATLGADIQALLATTTAAQERIYPFPRCENVTFERTDTVYETAPSTRKYKIEGVGGVRTFNFELWAKDAVHQILREMLQLGCSDLDFYLVTVDGYLWGMKDNVNDTIVRGYEMATETFDAFKEYATDTTVQKIMASWDLDNAEVEACSFAITSEELGYKATTLKGNISGFQTLSAIDTTHTQSIVYGGFGSAGDRYDIVGLIDSNFALYNVTQDAAVTVVSVLETAPGTYSIEYADLDVDPGDELRVTITATGYDVAVTSYTGTL